MEIVTMDNEVVKAMMAKIDRIAAYVFKKENVPRRKSTGLRLMYSKKRMCRKRNRKSC